MSGRPNLLPKLDMGAVKEKDAKEKERTTKFGASMKKLSASIKRGMTPRGRTISTDLGGEVLPLIVCYRWIVNSTNSHQYILC
jgi:hypothetical protein